ncbi:glycosyltransferase family 2 protein [Geodermatophilus sp. SYSU D00525]
MSGNRESVAVVVVTYNSAPLLADLVASLPAGLGDLPWHLVVVDNASSDDSVAVASRLRPDATVVATGRNGGYAAGINAGIAAAPPHTCVLVLNPDVRLQPGCVPALVRALRQPGTGIAVPLLVDGDGRRIDSLRREPAVHRVLADAVLGATRAGRIGRLGESVTAEAPYRRPGVTDWAEGSTLLISSDCLRATGPWDESFFLYSEETEFALRARDRGFVTRFTPEAHAVHLEGGSSTSAALWPLVVTNRVRLHRRRHGRVPAAAFWAALLLREASRLPLRRPPNRAAVRALLDLRGLRRPPGPHSVVPRPRRAGARPAPSDTLEVR